MNKLTKILGIGYVVGELFLTPDLGLVQAHAQAALGFANNLVINPWMEIDQVNEGAAATLTRAAAGTFTYVKLGDGWNGTDASSTTGSPTVTFQNAALAPNGSAVDLKYATNATISTTHADGTLVTLEQRIEPYRIAPLQYGTANAQTSYLSFCAKASVAGTYGFYIAGGTSARTSDIAGGTSGSSYFHAFSIPTANQFSCYQFQIPGDTGGTWLATTATVDATHGATLGFVLSINGVTTKAYGTPTASAADGVWFNTSTAVNVIGNNSTYAALDTVASSTFELTGVKWSIDPSPLTHAALFELSETQRYYTKTFPTGLGGLSGTKPAQGVASLAGAFQFQVPVIAAISAGFYQYPVPMRAAPTVTLYDAKSAAADSNCFDVVGTSTTVVSTVDPGTVAGVNGVLVKCAASLVGTAGNPAAIHLTADSRI